MVGNCWCNCTMSLASATFCSSVRVSAGLPSSSKPPLVTDPDAVGIETLGMGTG